MNHEFIAKFEGGFAENHTLPAYGASQSIYGIARSQLVILNFLCERKVRRKNFGYDGYDIQLRTPRAGSFEFLFEIALSPAALNMYGALGLGVGGNLLTDLLKGIYRKAIGKNEENIWDRAVSEGLIKEGDFGALVEAITPALKSAHQIVGGGATNINININGNGNVVKFDENSKEFLTSFVIDSRTRAKEFSIGAFNANQGDGRAFDFDLGQLITFDFVTGIDRQSIELVTESVGKYALRRFEDINARVAARYTSINALDGTIKKMRFSQVRRSLNELDSRPYGIIE